MPAGAEILAPGAVAAPGEMSTDAKAFVLEVARQVAAAVGGVRVGIWLSPHGVNAGMVTYPEIDETYRKLVPALVGTGVHYVHLVDHSSMGAPPVPEMPPNAPDPATFYTPGPKGYTDYLIAA